MALYYRSQFSGSGGSAILNSYYIVSGNNRWLPGEHVNIDMVNDPLIIGDNVFNYSCNGDSVCNVSNINQPIIIGKNITNYCRLFYGMQNMNTSITFRNVVEDCSNMFFSTGNSNLHEVYIPDSVTNCSHMFYWTTNVSANIHFGNNILDMSGMFSITIGFNQPINIPNSVIDCSNMFNRTYDFNSDVVIGNNVVNCAYMFGSAVNFNLPITIPDSVVNCYGMFAQSNNFNSPVTIGNNVTDCGSMFGTAFNFNQDVYFSNSVNNLYRTFDGLNNFGKNVYIPYSGESINVSLMFAFVDNTGKSLRKNIFFNPKFNSAFNVSNQQSLVYRAITWTDMSDGNGFYNAAYNIYCYNNYTR